MTDQSTTQVPRSSAPDDAGEGAPSAQKPAERRKSESADYHRLADEARQLFASDEPPTDETDLAERLKWIAARLHIERFQPAEHRPESSADLVARVAASEWFKHEHLAKARRACGLATTKGA